MKEADASTTRDASRTRTPRVIVAATPDGVFTFPLPERGVLVIGRAASCEVRVDHESVSREHVRLTIDATMTIEDLGSRNGTTVGGVLARAKESVEVPPGSVVEIGDVLLTIVTPSRARGPSKESVRKAPAVADAKMKRIYALIDAIAPSDIAVLVTGEAGTGKEKLAETIHLRSPRGNRPFVAVSCAALSESVAQAELFGYEQDAFTGACATKVGVLESADGGTVFLDDVAELSLSVQAQVLRMLETNEIVRAGAREPRRVDVRVIASTKRDLAPAIHEKTFRSDLFYRLSGFSITLPPLRERPDDIEAIARSLADGRDFAPSAMEALRRHPFPGNVHELKSALKRAALVAHDGPITIEALGLSPTNAAALTDEGTRILAALSACAGNQQLAAKELGMSRSTLIRRLDALGLSRPRKGR